jgi:hypothetical protein
VRYPRIETGPSRIAGTGVFAAEPIPRGARVIEYLGERIAPGEADARYAGDPAEHPLVLLFTVDKRTVIDAGVGGNEARFINHSCAPNCEAIMAHRRIWILALWDIRAGEELTYDYNLTVGEEGDRSMADQYPCNCRSSSCRGTLFKHEPGHGAGSKACR